MLKFVPNNAHGLPQKRMGAQRACDSCRRRKKRCKHAGDPRTPSTASDSQQTDTSLQRSQLSSQSDVVNGTPDSSTRESLSIFGSQRNQQPVIDGGELSITPVSAATVHTDMDSRVAESRSAPAVYHTEACDLDQSGHESRFIGHLNPEGTFLAATSPAHTTGSGELEEVGVWLSDRHQSERLRRYPTLPVRSSQSDAMYCPNPVLSKILLPHLEESCMSLIPDSPDFEALCTIYFDEIHPMFPILDRQSFDAPPSHLPSRVTLGQVVCFIASSSSAAKPYLNLRTDGVRATLERGEFARQLSLAVRTSLSLGLVKDKFTLCQICALLSMYTQLADDRHLSVEMCARAIANAQTLGLHLPTRADQRNMQSFSRVFCCIWALDRLNAAFHGRPVTMHERDFGGELEASISAQDRCFQLFLRVTLLLDKVIDLYRPRTQHSAADWGSDFPDFESIVHNAGALRVKHNLLATIETFYHAVAILSCRSQSHDQPARCSPSHVRQSLSATRVLSMVSEDFHGKLSPVPIVPYAVSLALRFFYREFRFTKLPLFRGRAQKQLLIGCSILRELGQAFAVAAGIASLVEQTLNETDKAYASILQSHEPERSRMTREPETPLSAGISSTELSAAAHSGSVDWTLWDNMPDFDIFEHINPTFNLDAVDAALADDTQTVFPITYDGFTF